MDPFIYPIELNNDLGVSTYVAFLKHTTECVIDSINIKAKKMGKNFELVRVNKVTAARRAIYHLTLTIKDEANAGKIIQAEVSMREEKQLFVCLSCGRQRCPILVWCQLISSIPT
ncbi:hypothetical protein PHJA_001028900 [Phtheirospermum japonicum]|uniref:Uncharacterized protein n=1 Tax=Phtheirospermum japonicum TaxID=374723 RepID=A0A830BS64_9LAMI|nr:hypothetical protein PHJA_001028900 [Phtheirospermum japonicum]